jgi:hypothetical protein
VTMPIIASRSRVGMVVLLFVTACGQQAGAPKPEKPQSHAQAAPRSAARNQVRLLSPDELTEAEKKFGIAPRRDASVTYQAA